MNLNRNAMDPIRNDRDRSVSILTLPEQGIKLVVLVLCCVVVLFLVQWVIFSEGG